MILVTKNLDNWYQIKLTVKHISYAFFQKPKVNELFLLVKEAKDNEFF
jgi:hypothetical protein